MQQEEGCGQNYCGYYATGIECNKILYPQAGETNFCCNLLGVQPNLISQYGLGCWIDQTTDHLTEVLNAIVNAICCCPVKNIIIRGILKRRKTR